MPHAVNRVCASCPEPPNYDAEVDGPLPTYKAKCAPPEATLTCTSSERNASLCSQAFSEYTDVSSPPKKFRVQTITSTAYDVKTYQCCTPEGRVLYEHYYMVTPLVQTSTINPETCSGSTSQDSGTGKWLRYACDGSLLLDNDTFGAADVSGITPMVTRLTKTWSATETENWPSSGYGVCNDLVIRTETNGQTSQLSDEDTEADALARVTPTAGTSCRSLYPLRTNSFNFTVRTVKYTITATNLVVGEEYEGCVRIRRRKAYSGTEPAEADLDWEDVEPDTITAFTATSSTMEIATDIPLPGGVEESRGYEYEAVGAYIYPTFAGCDCPTSYVSP